MFMFPLLASELANLQKIESGTRVGSQTHEIRLFHLVLQREMPLCFLHADGLADNKFSFFGFWQVIPGVSTVCNASWPSGGWVLPSIFLETPQTIVFIRGRQSFVVGCFVFYLFSFPAPAVFVLKALERRLKYLWPPVTQPISQVGRARNLNG